MHIWTGLRLAAALLMALAGPVTIAASQSPATPPAYSLDISLLEGKQLLAAYELVVEPGKGYLLSLPGQNADVVVIDVAADTRAAAYQGFERDLGPHANAGFVHVSASLERAHRDASGHFHVEDPVGSGLLLPLTGRRVRADIPARGDSVEAPRLAAKLTIIARARPHPGVN